MFFKVNILSNSEFQIHSLFIKILKSQNLLKFMFTNYTEYGNNLDQRTINRN